MKMIEFLSPENLYLLLPLGLLFISAIAVHFVLRKRFNLFIQRSRAKEFARLRSNISWLAKYFFLGLMLAFLILTLSRPQIIQQVKHQNFLLLFDMSRSMSVEDYQLGKKSYSRLAMAQIVLNKLIDELPAESQLSAVSFVGSSSLYAPEESLLIRTLPQRVGPSRKELVALINWVHWNQAWQPGSPVQSSLIGLANLIEKQPGIFGQSPTVILITDGEENIGDSYVPEKETSVAPNSNEPAQENTRRVQISRDLFKDLKVQFLIIGVGTTTGGLIPEFDEEWKFTDYQKDYRTETYVVSRRDDAFLVELSQKLKGDYVKLNNPDDLNFLVNDVKYKTVISSQPKDLSLYTLLAALICFLVAIVL